MAFAGSYWSYSGGTYLDLASNGSFTLEARNGRVWGQWDGPGLFSLSSSITFTVGNQQFVCSVKRGKDQSIGSEWIELRSKKGSPVDGKWYLRK
jgi:hypothetical protein